MEKLTYLVNLIEEIKTDECEIARKRDLLDIAWDQFLSDDGAKSTPQSLSAQDESSQSLCPNSSISFLAGDSNPKNNINNPRPR